jgi:hypothetical protein
MDFLHGLQTSLFDFTKPNLQWDKTLLDTAKDFQRRFFEQGYLVTSESTLKFPSLPQKVQGDTISICVITERIFNMLNIIIYYGEQTIFARLQLLNVIHSLFLRTFSPYSRYFTRRSVNRKPILGIAYTQYSTVDRFPIRLHRVPEEQIIL